MNANQLLQEAADYTLQAEANYMRSEAAARDGIYGLRLFDAPLVGFSSAEDPLFEKLKEPGVIGPHHLGPGEWLPGTRTVISFFLPFTQEVRSSNRSQDGIPSPGWLYGRVEGQQFVNAFAGHIAALLEEQGFRALVPAQDPRFRSVTLPDRSLEGAWEGISFSSNWSERHAAYICGLGTFGLSKGLITEKGMAGRFCSILTNGVFPPTPRAYTGVYDYCIRCGACLRRCPGEAITLEAGKDHLKCAAFVGGTMKRYAPRYGCGKCQIQVPCESRIPKR